MHIIASLSFRDTSNVSFSKTKGLVFHRVVLLETLSPLIMETIAERLLHCHIKIKQMEMHKMHDNTLIMLWFSVAACPRRCLYCIET